MYVLFASELFKKKKDVQNYRQTSRRSSEGAFISGVPSESNCSCLTYFVQMHSWNEADGAVGHVKEIMRIVRARAVS